MPSLTRLRRSASASDEWRRARWMFASILLLHVIGFGVFIAFVVPVPLQGARDRGRASSPTRLGLRHAFDADHISAIDNTTRKLMNERRSIDGSKRPLSVGYFFSLGHSTIVVAIGAGHRHRREGGLRRRLQQQLRARAVRRRLRHHRLGRRSST